MEIAGKAWVFGDDIDTDLIVPGKYLSSFVEEAANHAFEAIRPGFADQITSGDIIVGGRNFGCGSSREIAPQVLKHLGIGCVLAKDFARLFFRNAIAVGLPALTLQSAEDGIEHLEDLIVDVDRGTVVQALTGRNFAVSPLPEKMREIIESGGIDGILKKIASRQT
jgi:3-isopropylmalate dehydratase small subunit